MRAHFEGYDTIVPIQEQIAETLTDMKVSRRELDMAIFVTEDAVNSLLENYRAGGNSGKEPRICLEINRLWGNISVKLSLKGTPFTADDLYRVEGFEADDEDVAAILRHIDTKAYEDYISVSNHHGTNTVRISVKTSPYNNLIKTFSALALGLLTGFVLDLLLPEQISSMVASKVFGTVVTVFFNAIKMLVGPLVFFSIASAVSDFTDLRVLGRLAGKVVGLFFATSFVSILIGIGTFALMPAGSTQLQSMVDDSQAASYVQASADVSFSLSGFIIGIIPSNFFNAFTNANMLQIIVIALLVGIASVSIGEQSKGVHEFLVGGNALFSRIVRMVVYFMPVVVFCSMAKLTMTVNPEDAMSLLSVIKLAYVGFFFVLVMFSVLLIVLGRTNPITFFRKFAPAMLTAFTLASSNATVPTSMEICTSRLKISRRLVSFSIPLGATINMNGDDILLTICSLFMCHVFGIPVTAELLTTMIIMIFVLAVGAPGVPGGSLVVMASLFPQLGIPADAVGLIVGFYPVVSMAMVMTNCTGDAVCTAIVARAEGLIEK